MCVEPARDAEKQKKVVGYKLFRVRGMGIYGLVYNDHVRYSMDKTYTSDNGPGFQAFPNKKDAVLVKKGWNRPETVRIVKVFLFEAKQGTVHGMSIAADNKLGWIAPKMSFPRKKK